MEVGAVFAREGSPPSELAAALVSFALVAGLTAMSSPRAAVEKRDDGGAPCFGLSVTPPGADLDPSCSDVAAPSSIAAGQADSALALDVDRAGDDAVLAWELPDVWTDGDEDNGEIDRFRVLRGTTPVPLHSIGVVAVGQGGSVLADSDRVVLGPE